MDNAPRSRGLVIRLWWVVVGLVFLFGIATQLGRAPRETFDFPIAVISGDRVAAGERPYIDFLALYGPVSHYATAAVIRVLRQIPPATAAQVWYVLLSGLNLALLSIWMFEIWGRRPAILGASAAALLVSGPMLSRFSYITGLPTALLLATCVLAKPALDQSSFRPSRSSVAVIGMASATVILLATKFNFGLYACASGGIAFLASAVAGGPSAKRALITYVVTLALAIAIVLAVLQATGMLLPLANQTLAFSAKAFTRHLAIASLDLSSILVFFAYLVAVVTLCAAAVGAGADREFSIAYFALLALCFVHYVWHRVDADHIQTPLLIVTSGLAAAASMWMRAGVTPPAAKGLLCAMALVAAFAVPQSWGLLLKRVVDRVAVRVQSSPAGIPGPAWNWVTRNGVAITQEEDGMIAFLNSRMTAADKVFWASAPDSCQSPSDECVNLSLYLAQGRLPVGYEWIFDPPFSSAAEGQRTMMRSLDLERVRLVGVARSRRQNPLLGNPPAETTLIDYIHRKYAPVQSFDCPPRGVVYDVYERRSD